MDAFTYDALPGRVVFSTGAGRSRLADEVHGLGAERVLLISTEQGRGVARDLAAPLGDRIVGHFTEVRPHVPIEIARRARQAAIEAGADCLLSIGGGSTTGTAKAIALETHTPIVAVPTTYAGSEMTPVWGLTERQRKKTGRAPHVQPRVVIYDPELTLSLPPSISGPSAMNALAHCVEAFYAPGANPITSLIAEEGIRAIAQGVQAVVRTPGDLEGRSEMLYGAYLAGSAFAVAGSGLHHKICHVLGGAYNLPHAETHMMVLPHVIAFNQPVMPEIAQRVARALGSDNAAMAIHDLLGRIGAPTALRDIGMNGADLDRAAALCLEAAPPSNPRAVDEAGLRAILAAAYDGGRPAT